MASRMEKYYHEDEKLGLRSKKNADLYKEISNSEIDKFEISNNATVLSNVNNNIDVEKIKKILDTKYNRAPKRKSIRIDIEDEKEKIDLDETKEYDINAILEKAKEEKEDNYEKERSKKLRDTQFNILSNLNLSKSSEDSETEEEKTLINLINTITEREMQNREKEIDPLGLLDGNFGESSTLENTELTNEDTQKEEETPKIPEKEIDKMTGIDSSFYTNSVQFTDSDFDDFNDLKAEVNSHKTLLIIVIVLLVMGFVIGLVALLNNFLNWNLF